MQDIVQDIVKTKKGRGLNFNLTLPVYITLVQPKSMSSVNHRKQSEKNKSSVLCIEEINNSLTSNFCPRDCRCRIARNIASKRNGFILVGWIIWIWNSLCDANWGWWIKFSSLYQNIINELDTISLKWLGIFLNNFPKLLKRIGMKRYLHKQSSSDVLPVLVVFVPVGHAKHWVCWSLFWYVPIGHSTHGEIPLLVE